VRLLEPIGSLEISRDLSRVAAKIRDSERAAEAWPEALKSLTEALGAAGAAFIVANKNSNSADWVCFSGLSECFKRSVSAECVFIDVIADIAVFGAPDMQDRGKEAEAYEAADRRSGV
jgi:hypothetical protein